MSIEISNESGDDADEPGLVALSRHVLDDMGVNPLAQLSIVLVDEPTMASLNERWMGESGPTDVLAFPMEDLDPGHGPEEPDVGVAVLGDVVLCPAVAARQAAGAGHPVADELRLLCAHGVLHLLGYDHAEPEEEHQMFALQDRLLASYRATRRAPEPRQ